jgi:hypothetical protein
MKFILPFFLIAFMTMNVLSIELSTSNNTTNTNKTSNINNSITFITHAVLIITYIITIHNLLYTYEPSFIKMAIIICFHYILFIFYLYYTIK